MGSKTASRACLWKPSSELHTIISTELNTQSKIQSLHRINERGDQFHFLRRGAAKSFNKGCGCKEELRTMGLFFFLFFFFEIYKTILKEQNKNKSEVLLVQAEINPKHSNEGFS
jgi:hypothetical protein